MTIIGSQDSYASAAAPVEKTDGVVFDVSFSNSG
jgi:hypothetical protein